MEELVLRVCRHSNLHDPAAVISLCRKKLKEYKEKTYSINYLTQDEIVDKILQIIAKQIHLNENLKELHTLFRRYWVYAPLLSDVKEFFNNCPFPIFIISNNGIPYIEKSMKDKKLSPAGIICADMVKAYNPHRGLFEKALELSGQKTNEVVHIGNSYSSDVLGALSAGIHPLFLDRNGNKTAESIKIIHSLSEALKYLEVHS